MQVQFIAPRRWYEITTLKLTQSLTLQNITIPAGFITDGASVPRWLPLLGILLLLLGHLHPLLYPLGLFCVLSLALFPRFGNTLHAAILHDYLLKHEHWRLANKLFCEQLKADHVQPWRVFIMFWSVTLWQGTKAAIRFIKGLYFRSPCKKTHHSKPQNTIND